MNQKIIEKLYDSPKDLYPLSNPNNEDVNLITLFNIFKDVSYTYNIELLFDYKNAGKFNDRNLRGISKGTIDRYKIIFTKINDNNISSKIKENNNFGNILYTLNGHSFYQLVQKDKKLFKKEVIKHNELSVDIDFEFEKTLQDSDKWKRIQSIYTSRLLHNLKNKVKDPVFEAYTYIRDNMKLNKYILNIIYVQSLEIRNYLRKKIKDTKINELFEEKKEIVEKTLTIKLIETNNVKYNIDAT